MTVRKFEQFSNVGFAVALLTRDDLGCSKSQFLFRTFEEAQKTFLPRARQNVVFEFGYFIGKLSRSRVCALVEDGLEKPSDLDGIVYIPLDGPGAWKIALAKEMKRVGLDVDMNKLI